MGSHYDYDGDKAYNASWVAKGVWPHNTQEPTWWGKDTRKMAAYAKECYDLNPSDLKFKVEPKSPSMGGVGAVAAKQLEGFTKLILKEVKPKKEKKMTKVHRQSTAAKERKERVEKIMELLKGLTLTEAVETVNKVYSTLNETATIK